MAEAQRVEIGFEGGQVISVRLGDGELKDLRKQLDNGGWHDVKTEDGILAVYLGKVAFLRDRLRRAPGRLLPRSGLMRAPDAARPGRRGDPRRRTVVAQEPVRLSLRAAVLGRSTAPGHHPRPAALGPRARSPASACSRSGREPATTHRHGRLGRPRGPGRDLRPPAEVPRPCDAGLRRAGPTSSPPRAMRPTCPTRTPRSTR